MRSIKNEFINFLRKIKVVVDIISLPEFASKSRKVRIETPRKISNPKQIWLGNNVHMGTNSFLSAIDDKKVPSSGKIIIGNNFEATGNLQIHAISNVTIEDDVLMATNVFIVDCSHGYDKMGIPYAKQGHSKIAPVIIKRGCWIGQNVVILQGVVIGEFSIIGANSVDRKSTRLNSSHLRLSRMPSSA